MINEFEIDWICEALKIGAVSLVALVLMIVAQFLRQNIGVDIERTRKFVHLGSGMITLSFGFFFDTHWSILILALLFIGVMVLTRRRGLLSSVHAVDRMSSGDVLFPAAVYLCFLLSRQLGQPIFYFISVATLALPDTLAALVGKTYGHNFYIVENDRKTLEGSVMFFLTAYLIIHLSLLLGTDLSRLQCVLMAFWVASMVTCFEAICTNGSDNFFIPLGTLYLLWKITDKIPAVVLDDIYSLYGSIALSFALLWPRRKIDASGILGIALLLNAASRLLQPHWGLPVLTAMVIFNYGNVVKERSLEHAYQIRSVFYAVLATLVWIFISNLYDKETGGPFILPYLINLCAILDLGWAQVWNNAHPDASLKETWGAFLKRLTIFEILFLAPQMYFDPGLARISTPIMLALVMVASEWFFTQWRNRNKESSDISLLIRQGFAVTMLFSALTFAFALIIELGEGA